MDWYFLDASFEDIYKRVQHDPNRPIVQSSTKEELEGLYHYRRKFYRDAGHIQVLTEGRTIRQILEYLVFQVKRLKTNDNHFCFFNVRLLLSFKNDCLSNAFNVRI